MSLDRATEVLTTMAVVAALMVNGYQVRQAIRQTNVMQHEVLGALVGTFTDNWITFFLDHPDLCAWFLQTRGYAVTTVEENRRRLYALVRFNTHEGIYLQRALRGLRKQSWVAWTNVLRADLQVAEFREVWVNARRFFDLDFVRHVDRLLEETPPDGRERQGAHG
jgi:hypothetical protein